MTIEYLDRDGHTLVRDSIVAAFFSRRPYPELASVFGDIFERWIQGTPDAARLWAVVGGNAEEPKTITPRLLSKARAEFDGIRAKKQEICALQIGGSQSTNPEWQFDFLGHNELVNAETNYLELRIPPASVDQDVERYVDFFRRIGDALPCASGYVSPALVWGSPSQQSRFAVSAKGWAFRHPGFDVPYTLASSFVLGTRLRGTYWLTFVGPDAIDDLGGEARLRAGLPRQVTAVAAGRGLMLRASERPEIGDVNRLDKLPTLRSLARILEPVTLVDDDVLDDNFVDDDQRRRWQRRHLD